MPEHSDLTPDDRTSGDRMPDGISAGGARRVRLDPTGPVLVEGPVEIVLEDGTLARSDRFMVAVCTCRRSRTLPWCDTSHRARRKPAPADGAGQPRAGHGGRAGRSTAQDGDPR
ncbi:CDGSH iron-sulfur domain-containing protein [Streptomyces fructofermentans]|uniref:Iron-binding zinc finger CDGSH type domain-containing protein n=1 Tax=Streptomyces fructofermentans TaxID=152141 RepID=A0A918NMF8_9ACTN|nr:hypothetical protein GCM10010515_55710 [Streptomyces fructofermentans]